MIEWLAQKTGALLARYLEKRSNQYEPFSVTNPDILRQVLRPGDVLLVEGNQRVSSAIKYLTQSTWSHATLYIGEALGKVDANGEALSLIEADLSHGVIAVPLTKYSCFNTRICRAVGLKQNDQQTLVDYMVRALGFEYDLKNIIDLARYLLPTPPVPVHWRRRMLALGSGDPTRAICSTLIAKAYQSIHYPILPYSETQNVQDPKDGDYVQQEILHIRHYSLFTPRDFDLSPYFDVVKPTLENQFDYKAIQWAEDQASTNN